MILDGAAGGPRGFRTLLVPGSGRRVTLNTYAHVLPALRQEAADAIDELFGA